MNMEAVKGILSPLPLNTKSVQDTLKLVVVGGTVETALRASISAWNGFVDSFFLTAHFIQEDYPYDWLMHWLSKQPAWSRSREFDITTHVVGWGQAKKSTCVYLVEEGVDENGEHELEYTERKVRFMPANDVTHTFFYHGHWLKITHTRRYQDYGHNSALKISVLARNNDILKRLVLEAKREYEKDSKDYVRVFVADTKHVCWQSSGLRKKRPMSSIVLEPGVKERLLADSRDFLQSEDWYGERGMPFRRGYLLYGMPRSGKTSLILSLAGELGLDIYVASLSSKGMSDNTLMTLIGDIPSPCILLFEELDTAFDWGVSRDYTSNGAQAVTEGSTLSLSGLLSCLDWAAAARAQLLFTTTNHVERIDPVLSRPGRMDVWVNFTNATKWQAESIFKRFFSSAPPVPTPNEARAMPMDAFANESPTSIRGASAHGGPTFNEAEISQLAKRFADAIPEGKMSVASLEGYLVKYRTRPVECVEEVAEWVQKAHEAQTWI